MMRWIIQSSLRLRLVIVAFAAGLMAFSFSQFDDMPIDALPEFSRPYVEIQTEALGLSADEVEALITTPLEADLLNGVSWVQEIRSESIPGLSSIVLVFEKGTDIMRARQMVQERLIAVHALPNVSKPPTMLNPISSANRTVEIGLTSDELSLIDLSVLARWTIVPRLMGLPGVANVSIWGQRKRQLQVQVDPERLRQEGITLRQIINTTGNALWVSPLSFLEASTPGTGGWIDTPNQRLGVRHLLPISKAEELGRVVIEGASPKRLGDVARVVEDHQPLIGDAVVNDAAALILVVEKFPWASTLEVTEEVEDALAALRPGLTGVRMDSTLFRPATYLELSAENFAVAFLIGLVLAAVLLLAFNWRTAWITAAAVLASAAIFVGVIYLQGAAINMMVIAGALIALAAGIDDAVIDVENVVRRLLDRGADRDEIRVARIVLAASMEMRRPILYATLIMLLVASPVLFLEGAMLAFFGPLISAYVIALLASFLTALTLTPTLCVVAYRYIGLGAGESPVASILRRGCSTLFSWVPRAPRAAFAAICVLLVASIAAVPLLRQESLLPEFKETDLIVMWRGSSSASHPAMSRIASRVSKELRAVPGVRNVSAHVGRAVMSDKRSSIDSGELRVSIDSTADYEATVAGVEEVISGYPGLSPEVLTFLQAKVREELSGTDKSLVVRVYGEDMDVLRKKAKDVNDVLSRTSGIVMSEVHYPVQMPTLEIEVDIDRAGKYGLKPGDVRRAATSLVSGIEVGSLFEEQKVFDVMVYGTAGTRHSVSAVRDLLIDTAAGGHVRLKDVADVRIVAAPTVIKRDAVARRIDVTANVRGRDLASVAAEVKRGIQELNFPLEYRAELRGEYAERLSAQERIIAFAVVAAAIVLLLLQSYFGSWALAAVTFLTLPAVLLGGILAALVDTGGLVSMGGMVAFVAIFAFAARNSTVLVARYLQIAREGSDGSDPALIWRATAEQSVPILVSVLSTALVMMPLALTGDIAGLEMAHPIAVVVLGGLVSATLYTFVGIPAIYVLFGPARELEFQDLSDEGRTRSESAGDAARA